MPEQFFFGENPPLGYAQQVEETVKAWIMMHLLWHGLMEGNVSGPELRHCGCDISKRYNQWVESLPVVARPNDA